VIERGGCEQRTEYRVKGHDALIYKARPVWDDPTRWIEHGIAKIRLHGGRSFWVMRIERQGIGEGVMARFTDIWEFYVAPSVRAQFALEYGPRGSWVTLFRKAPGYIETLLLHDHSDPSRYVTVDRWESQEAYRSFHRQFSQQYEEIDRRCRGLTIREGLIGEFSEDV